MTIYEITYEVDGEVASMTLEAVDGSAALEAFLGIVCGAKVISVLEAR